LSQSILLITPPFTQLNTPYPATAYIKGFLNTIDQSSYQCDLGIEVIWEMFSSDGFKNIFDELKGKDLHSENSQRIVSLQKEYIKTIDLVIDFLQDKNPTLAHAICDGNFLPEASRFMQLDDMDWAFGTMGSRDKARYLATLYLEDIADLIREELDAHFGFSRYAERLGRSASEFDKLHDELQNPNSFVDKVLLQILEKKMQNVQPNIVAVSVPFPGNLYSAFKCGQYIKKNYPEVQVVMGGGFANTELRSLKEPRVFEYFDFITLDDGETPFSNLIEHIEGKRNLEDLKRTFALVNGVVIYFNNSKDKDVPQRDVGTPDYSDFELNKYLSVIEIANPMHRLWSDGRWNKLTLAHGCYWGKCTFCDISLDYIRRYEQTTAQMLCDRIEELIKQTGVNGFHFVDEAAPPALMRDLALEILRRNITVVWWTNIRFEKSFTKDLCLLLKESGCIAISGGLEVASDRLLALINKGVTVSQVAKVAQNFTEAGIMVHAYLMYGFPTQTAQETIDSLEVVRQLFMHGVVQSGFWHQFAMTAHSPVGLNPEQFNVESKTTVPGKFANNDMIHTDKLGVDHDKFSEGLRKSLFNYMHGICFDFKLDEWFDFNVPRTTIGKNFIEFVLANDSEKELKSPTKVVWLGKTPVFSPFQKTKKGKVIEMAELSFANKKYDLVVKTDLQSGTWLADWLPKLSSENSNVLTLGELEEDFQKNTNTSFKLFWNSQAMNTLRENGLLVLN
jgi:hypothetical protein